MVMAKTKFKDPQRKYFLAAVKALYAEIDARKAAAGDSEYRPDQSERRELIETVLTRDKPQKLDKHRHPVAHDYLSLYYVLVNTREYAVLADNRERNAKNKRQRRPNIEESYQKGSRILKEEFLIETGLASQFFDAVSEPDVDSDRHREDVDEECQLEKDTDVLCEHDIGHSILGERDTSQAASGAPGIAAANTVSHEETPDRSSNLIASMEDDGHDKSTSSQLTPEVLPQAPPYSPITQPSTSPAQKRTFDNAFGSESTEVQCVVQNHVQRHERQQIFDFQANTVDFQICHSSPEEAWQGISRDVETAVTQFLKKASATRGQGRAQFVSEATSALQSLYSRMLGDNRFFIRDLQDRDLLDEFDILFAAVGDMVGELMISETFVDALLKESSRVTSWKSTMDRMGLLDDQKEDFSRRADYEWVTSERFLVEHIEPQAAIIVDQQIDILWPHLRLIYPPDVVRVTSFLNCLEAFRGQLATIVKRSLQIKARLQASKHSVKLLRYKPGDYFESSTMAELSGCDDIGESYLVAVTLMPGLARENEDRELRLSRATVVAYGS